MKLKLWIILALAALIVALGANAALADESGICGANLTWSLNSNGVLNITGTGPMADYSSGNAPWYSYRTNISTINVNSGVTSIGSYAFEGCSRAIVATMQASVTAIGNNAFRNCSWLSTVTLREGLLTIDNSAFYGCADLTSVTIPSSVTSIGYMAFAQCTDLTSVTVNNPECEIGDVDLDVFTYSENVTLYGAYGSTARDYAEAANIPFLVTGSCGENVSYIFDPINGALTISGTGAMANYADLTALPWDSYLNSIISVSIDSGVTSIGYRAFRACHGLTSVTIPTSVTSIGDWAFDNCTSLTSVTIPTSVTSIGYGAFYGCFGLTSVTIPNSVTSIGNYAFRECTSLTSVTIPNSVASIGFLAFGDCTGLTSVTIPNSVASIGYQAFKYCTGLTDVTILNPECAIGDSDHDVFKNCSASLVLHGWSPSTAQTYAQAAGIAFDPWYLTGSCGDNVNYSFDPITGEMTISGTGEMTNYEYMSSQPWADYRSLIHSIVIQDGVTTIGSDSFEGCKNLDSIAIPDSVQSIEPFSLRSCSSLTSVSIPSGVIRIGARAFEYSGLISIVISNNVTNIGDYAFQGCSSLTSAAIPNSVYVIGASAFYYCISLSSVTISNPDAIIGTYAFTNCPASLIFHGWAGSTAQTYAQENGFTFDAWETSGSCGVNLTWSFDPFTGTLTISGYGAMEEYINALAFPWYSFRESIKALVIGTGVTKIHKLAFYGCTGLSSVSIPLNVTEIGYLTFANCSGLTSVTVSNKSMIIGDDDHDVFEGCAPGFTLRGWPDSTAEAYAGNTDNPCGFESLFPAPTFRLPASLATIEADAFLGIQASSVIIPPTVTSIDGNPFGNVTTVIYVHGVPGTAAETLTMDWPGRFVFIPVSAEWIAAH